MEPTIGNKALTREQRDKYLESLNEETLSALMRSTWTWDDRALRRTLGELVTGLTAVRELRVGEVGCPAPVLEAAESRVLAATGEFVAEVLGPRLLVDADNAFRDSLLPLVEATDALTAEASRALDTLAVDVTGQVIERNESLSAVLPEDRWEEKAFSGSAAGLARVGYSAGYTLADRDYFAAAGLGAQAYTIAGSRSTTASTCTGPRWRRQRRRAPGIRHWCEPEQRPPTAAGNSPVRSGTSPAPIPRAPSSWSPALSADPRCTWCNTMPPASRSSPSTPSTRRALLHGSASRTRPLP